MDGRERPPSAGRPRRLTTRETDHPVPDLSGVIARAQARAGAAVHDRGEAVAPRELTPPTVDAAEALVRAVFPVAEVTVYVDRGDDGWRAIGTGERAPWG